MKTRTSTLLGAALCLLITLTTAHAAGKGKGGGGGGGGNTPQGTIYFYGPIPGSTGPTQVTHSINADGSNDTVVGSGGRGLLRGNPSWNLHNNHRWFLGRTGPFTDQYYPDGSQRRELVATRDDYENDNNNPQTRSDLTDDITLQWSGVQWLPGDEWISFIARRWSSADTNATVVEGGIYVLPLLYDADGTVIGLGELPTTPTIPLPLVPDEYPLPGIEAHPLPDVEYYSWAPEGDRFVCTKRSDPYGAWVADLLTGTETKITSEPAHMPEWSPDGRTIVYGVGEGFVTIKPSGKSRLWVFRPTSEWSFFHAFWSPDSKWLAFTGQSKVGSGNDLFIGNVSNTELIQLTDTPGMAWERLFEYSGGWR